MEKSQLLDLIASCPDEELAKAVKDAKGLHGIRIIKDMWSDGEFHSSPERNDTKTGPALAAHGGSAEKTVNEYSNPAPQVGLTQSYAEFQAKNLEGFGRLGEAMKSLNEEIQTGFGALLETIKSMATKKAEEKEEKKEEKKEKFEASKKDPDPDPDPDPKSKADLVAYLWNSLAELEEAYAKAEFSDGDASALSDVRIHIEKAESCAEEVEEHDGKGKADAAVKAQVSINLGWKSLMKATGLNSYDLKGYGNQADDAVPGDSTSDQSKKDLKKAEAKAKYYAMKAEQLRTKLGIKAESEKKEEKEEKKEKFEASKKDPDPDPDPDPKSKADVESMIDSVKADFNKMVAERVSELNKRIESVTGRQMTPMVPVVIKSAGIKSDEVLASIEAKIETAQEGGALTEEHAGIARSITQQYLAAGKGFGSPNIVTQRLDRSPVEVQSFFNELESAAI